LDKDKPSSVAIDISIVFRRSYVAHGLPSAFPLRRPRILAHFQAMETVTGITPGSPAENPQVRAQRSRLTTRALLPGVDGRSPWVRRCKDLIALHLSDLPAASIAEQSIIRRASVLTVELERLEAKFAEAGEASPFDLDLYQRTAGGLRRLLEAVGLERRLRDVTNPVPRSRTPSSPTRADLLDVEVTR
jgi:hypothetical protein